MKMKINTKQLEIKNLTVSFENPQSLQKIEVVKSLSLTMGHERVGIVGESGSGKSMTARAILGLIKKPGLIQAQALNFYSPDQSDTDKLVCLDLLKQTQSSWQHVRGRKISMIMQDPKYSLNPVMSVFDQIREAVLLHKIVPKPHIKEYVMGLLDEVGITDPLRIAKSYAHQLSGGIGQRVMIAMMLAPKPELLIADEPTSALDVMVRDQILSLLDKEIKTRKMGLLMISHDLKMVAKYCDRVLIMYQGEIVESLDATQLFSAKHPYTQGLLNCLPSLDTRGKSLPTLDRSLFEVGL